MIFRVCALVALVFVLSACGRKGPLVLSGSVEASTTVVHHG